MAGAASAQRESANRVFLMEGGSRSLRTSARSRRSHAVKDGKYRVLLLCEHPVQYNTILWSLQARHPKLDILVAYCSLRGADAAVHHPDFGVETKWDVP